MRVVFLTADQPRQRALATRIDSVPGVTLAGILVQERVSHRDPAWIRKAVRKQPARVMNKVLGRLFFNQIIEGLDREELRRFGRLGQPPAWPSVPLGRVAEINGMEAVRRIAALEPDLIAVSGTGLIKAPVFDLAPPRGLINLHTGISPYYKGGPNCTLWCLANREPQFIGSTLHVLDPGIDSGSILMTAQTRVEAEDSAAALACRAVATGHDLYVQVLQALAAGRTLEAVPQERVGTGRTYYSRDWNVRHLARAAFYVQSGGLARWVAAGRPGADRVMLVDVVNAERVGVGQGGSSLRGRRSYTASRRSARG